MIVLIVANFVFFVLAWAWQALSKLTIRKLFKNGNVIVFGKKGKGKDLLFQYIIKSNCKKNGYYSNIDYGGKHFPITLNEINLKNTFESLVQHQLKREELDLAERTDVFVSDGGVYLPAQYHGRLDKQYGGMPLYYALSRHLFDSNIHINTQALNRPWDKLREQADSYIKCLSARVIFGKIVIQKIRVYDKYTSALEDVRPFRRRGSDESKALRDQWASQYGQVFEKTIIWLLPKKHYDTRYFRTLLYSSTSAPDSVE